MVPVESEAMKTRTGAVRADPRAYAIALLCLLLSVALLSCATGPSVWDKPRSVPNRITVAVQEAPEEQLPLLISFIRENSADEAEMFRYAHDWVAQNVAYDVEAYRGGEQAVTDAYGVIAYGKSVCAGYAEVLKLLCDELGIRSEMVSGYARGASFDPFTEPQRDPEDTNHRWNAVYLEGRWHLVDVTWNAGSVGRDGFSFNYNLNYYKIDPDVFAYTHFPTDPKWQLLDPPLTYSQFIQRPRVRGSAARFAVENLGDYDRVIRPDSGSYRMVFSSQPETVLRASLRTYDGGSSLREHRLLQADGNGSHIVDLRFPAEGRYQLSLWAAESGDHADAVSIARYYFEVAHSEKATFPVTYSRFAQNGLSDLFPLTGTLPRGEAVEFSFNSGNRRNYYLYVPDEGSTPMRRNSQTGRYEVQAPIRQADHVYLSVKHGKRYYHMVRYQIQ